MRVAAGLAANAESGRLKFTQLVPRHIAAQAAVNGLCGHKDGGCETIDRQTRHRLFIDRQIGVINGDGDRAVGKRFACLQMRYNIIKRPYIIPALCKNLEMLFKLFQPHICAREVVLAESVIHQDDSMVGSHGRGHKGRGGKAR